jgi:hypothetical protein
MVASIPEYHILGKRVPVDRLRLGTVIASIQDLARLNPGNEPTIDENRLDYWHDTAFKATRDDTLKGDVGVEFKIAALEGVGGEGKVNGERDNVEKYSFSAIDTLEFESMQKDYIDAGKDERVQAFLKSSRNSPVFYITGIKVGRVSTDDDSEPTFEVTRVKGRGGTLSLGVNIPSAASIGPNVSGIKNLTIAIRVRKLQYKKKRFFGPRELVSDLYNDGAELAGRKNKEKEKEKERMGLDFDNVTEVDFEEKDLEGYKKITETNKRGDQITYLILKD